jgi:hypothetical protein
LSATRRPSARRTVAKTRWWPIQNSARMKKLSAHEIALGRRPASASASCSAE